MFIFPLVGTFVGFHLPTDCSPVNNTCAPRVWVSTVQSPWERQWGTVGSSCLVWVHLIQKVVMSHPWFPSSGWGQLWRISKSWKWPGTSSLERPPHFFMGSHFSVSAEGQWLGFGAGSLGPGPEIRLPGAARPPRTAHWAAPARLEGTRCPPGWVQAALSSRGAPAAHL